MNAETLALARRAAKLCPWQEWPEGSKFVDDQEWLRLLDTDDTGDRWAVTWEGEVVPVSFTAHAPGRSEFIGLTAGHYVPDLDDPLTAIGVLCLVRRKRGDAYVTVERALANDEWSAIDGVGELIGDDSYPTELAALVAALDPAVP